MPKFRGDENDWLDSDAQNEQRRSAAKKKPKGSRAEWLAPELGNASVVEVFPKQCRVKLDSGGEALRAYRWAGVVGGAGRGSDARERSPVAVGDRVRVGEDGAIEGVCERRNRLSRPAPGREGTVVQHVIAANIDLVAVVASVDKPEFTPGLVDRYLVAAGAAGIPALLIVTKSDLRSVSPPWKLYVELGYEVREVSVRTGDGLPELRARLERLAVVFCGKSGVGKTSLLGALLGREVGRIGELSASTGKGQHTTTGALLLDGPSGARWIDTPGVRELGLGELEPGRLRELFPELRDLRCGQPGCLHRGEELCAAPPGVRLESYRRILASLIAGEG